MKSPVKSKSAKAPKRTSGVAKSIVGNPAKPPAASTSTSKQDAILALLRKPGGAGITSLVKATNWQPHSIRGFLSGVVRKKLGLSLRSEKLKGERRYRIEK